MRLIDADDVLSHVKPYEVSDEKWICTGGTTIGLIHTVIDNAPTVDAVVVKYGKWKLPKRGDKMQRVCSSCSNTVRQASVDVGQPYLYNFCPYCGAKMIGEEE